MLSWLCKLVAEGEVREQCPSRLLREFLNRHELLDASGLILAEGVGGLEAFLTFTGENSRMH